MLRAALVTLAVLVTGCGGSSEEATPDTPRVQRLVFRPVLGQVDEGSCPATVSGPLDATVRGCDETRSLFDFGPAALTGADLREVRVDVQNSVTASQQTTLVLTFAAGRMADVGKRHDRKRLAIIFDGQVLAMPMLMGLHDDAVQVTAGHWHDPASAAVWRDRFAAAAGIE